MAKKQINVRVDEDEYATIEERAQAVGMDVAEYARTVLADEGSDLRHRFLNAGAHFAEEWGDHFAERFGHPAPAKHEPHGHAA
ncbi:hypothetical protein ACFY30_18005 [Streptomyces sp. NPDC000345]|uniref:plasmid mobilization protein n=1 Tax=Streptomyces sp. NPDC000345 TaxID=3364537 RepID=UPI00367986F3